MAGIYQVVRGKISKGETVIPARPATESPAQKRLRELNAYLDAGGAAPSLPRPNDKEVFSSTAIAGHLIPPMDEAVEALLILCECRAKYCQNHWILSMKRTPGYATGVRADATYQQWCEGVNKLYDFHGLSKAAGYG